MKTFRQGYRRTWVVRAMEQPMSTKLQRHPEAAPCFAPVFERFRSSSPAKSLSQFPTRYFGTPCLDWSRSTWPQGIPAGSEPEGGCFVLVKLVVSVSQCHTNAFRARCVYRLALVVQPYELKSSSGILHVALPTATAEALGRGVTPQHSLQEPSLA